MLKQGDIGHHYYLKKRTRPTRGLDIVIREDPETFLPRLEKAFASSYIFPGIQAGYTMSLNEMKEAVNR